MGEVVLILFAAVVTTGASAGALMLLVARQRGGIARNIGNLKNELEQKQATKRRIEELYEQMIDASSLHQLAADLLGLEESLKAERGRITITQAEIETVETRLRELEEIERELEASALETKEELNILQKKEATLRKSNEELKEKIASATQRIEQLLSEIEMSAQVKDQITSMQTELLKTQEKIDVLMLQVEQGNEQYFVLKKRYDALDIEYAQLYEKFAISEEASGGGN